MERGDVEGAEAAARYFLSLYPYAYNTGDLEEWIALSDPECVFCASVVERVTELHESGGYETGGELTFESVTGSEPIPGNAYFGVDLVVVQGPSTAFDADGAVTSETEGGRYVMYTALGRNEQGWLMRELTPERQEP